MALPEEETPVAVLLQTATYEELLQLERRVSVEVEAKQNNLRQLVGESYKDLIESANSVLAMQQNIGQVECALRSLNTCLASETFGRTTVSKQRHHDTSAADLPEDELATVVGATESIWEALEHKQMSKAAIQFLSAEVAFHSIPEFERAKSLAAQNSWEVLSDLKLQIEHLAMSQLMVPFCKPSLYSDSLLALRSLGGEHSEATAVFALFLDSRTAWVAHLIGASAQVPVSQQLLSDTIRTLQCTLLDTVAIFGQHPSGTQLSLEHTDFASQLGTWISQSVETVGTQLETMLDQISEGRTLTELQQAAINAAAEPLVNTSDDTLSWDDALRCAAPHSAAVSNIWSDNLGPIFERRACAVITLGFDKLDIASHLASAAHKLHDKQHPASIGMIVQQVCSTITSQMQAVLQDVQSLFLQDSGQSEQSSSSQARLADFFQDKCCQHLQQLAASATSRLEELQAAGEEGAVDSTVLDEALLLGGVCGALADGANELLASVTPNRDASESLKQGAQEELQRCHVSAYSLWVKWTVAAQSAELQQSQGSVDRTLQDQQTHWEEVPSADGATVRLPTHLSTATLQYLYLLCQQAIRIGANAAGATVQSMLQKGAYDGAVVWYQQEACKTHTVSAMALQCILDLRFLEYLLVPQNDSAYLQRSQSLIDKFASQVDPIEFEISDEPIRIAVNKLYQRFSVLLGPIAGQNCTGLDPGTTNISDAPNMLKLAPVLGRFTLLATQMFPPPPAFAMEDGSEDSTLDETMHANDDSPRSPVTSKGMVETLLTSHTGFSGFSGLSTGFSKFLGN